MKSILITTILLLLFILCSFRSSTGAGHAGEVPTTAISISCLYMDRVKGLVVISSTSEYNDFIDRSSASSLDGCQGYNAPSIDFNAYYLFVVHGTSGGCEDPIVEKSFFYNTISDKYEYTLILKQKGICKALHHFFESVLVKKSDIDLSKLTFSIKEITPQRENKE